MSVVYWWHKYFYSSRHTEMSRILLRMNWYMLTNGSEQLSCLYLSQTNVMVFSILKECFIPKIAWAYKFCLKKFIYPGKYILIMFYPNLEEYNLYYIIKLLIILVMSVSKYYTIFYFTFIVNIDVWYGYYLQKQYTLLIFVAKNNDLNKTDELFIILSILMLK